MTTRKSLPRGRLIDAGHIALGGSSDLAVDAKRRDPIETRLRTVEEFARVLTEEEDRLPKPMSAILLDCARAGIRRGKGRSGSHLSQAEVSAREAAMREAPALLEKYRAEAKATGRRNWKGWARERTAEALRQRMSELGVIRPPAVSTIVSWKF